MGNVDALHKDDVFLSVIILLINLIAFYLFFNGWKLTTFDPGFAKTLGISSALFDYLLMILVSLTVVGAFRAVGVLMVLTFITAPPLLARLFCHRLSRLLVISALIAALASILSVALSRHFLTAYGLALSTGGLLVTLLGSAYLIAAFIKSRRYGKAVLASE
jgi:manganese/zinc/iron transport system permease protein